MGRCRECGVEDGKLTASGVCAWRAGCDHRLMQAEASAALFDADYRYHFDRFPCGHTAADHAVLAGSGSGSDIWVDGVPWVDGSDGTYLPFDPPPA